MADMFITIYRLSEQEKYTNSDENYYDFQVIITKHYVFFILKMYDKNNGWFFFYIKRKLMNDTLARHIAVLRRLAKTHNRKSSSEPTHF